MFIITNKEDNVILHMGEVLDYMDNGYPRLVNENVAFPTEMVNVNDVELVPEEVEAGKYCFTVEDYFYKNPNYTEPNPYGIDDETYTRIIDDYTLELMEGGLI